CDPRAYPADREQHAQEARAPARGAGAQERGLLALPGRPTRPLERYEKPAVRALEAEVAGGATALDPLGGKALMTVRALDVEALVLGDVVHVAGPTRRGPSPRISAVRRRS